MENGCIWKVIECVWKGGYGRVQDVLQGSENMGEKRGRKGKQVRAERENRKGSRKIK